MAQGAQGTQEKSKEILRKSGMRVTAPRLRVLALLDDRGVPLTRAEISESLSDIDKVTLYRILFALSGCGILHQVHGTDGATRFCVHAPSHQGCPGNHPHFLCRVCGRMSCLPDQPIGRIEVPEGTVVEGKQLLLFGICPGCNV